MKKLIRISSLSGALLSLLLFSGCSGPSGQKTKYDDKSILLTDSTNKEPDFVTSFNAPSPEEVLSFFENSNTNYNPNLLHIPEKATGYLDSKSQCLNLGIYMADVAYMNMFDQSGQVGPFEATVFHLSEKIKISQAFDQSLSERLLNNIGNIDSTVYLSEQIYFGIVDYLSNNGMNNTLSLISIGTYIEIMHLTLQSIDNYDAGNELIEHIEDQKMLFSQIYDFALTQSLDPGVKEVLHYLNEINAIFNHLEMVEGETTTANDKKNTLVVSGGTSYKMNKEQFDSLKKLIESIRKDIIK